MAFKEKLRELLDKQGGRSPENLERIARKARSVQADFTLAYLSKLLMGFPARDEDYQALGAALGVSPTELIDNKELFESENRKKARKFATERMNRPDLAERLIQCIELGRFREEVVSEQELYLWFSHILESLEDEGN